MAREISSSEWQVLLRRASRDVGQNVATGLKAQQRELQNTIASAANRQITGLWQLQDSFDRELSSVSLNLEEVASSLHRVEGALQHIHATLQRPIATQAKELAERARFALKNGWHADALNEAQRALEIDALDPQAHFIAGRALLALHQRESAGTSFANAAKYAAPLSARLTRTCALLAADLMDEKGSLEEAEVILRGALVGQPHSPTVNFALGRRGSDEHLAAALHLDPSLVVEAVAAGIARAPALEGAAASLRADIAEMEPAFESLCSALGDVVPIRTQMGCGASSADVAALGLRRADLAHALLRSRTDVESLTAAPVALPAVVDGPGSSGIGASPIVALAGGILFYLLAQAGNPFTDPDGLLRVLAFLILTPVTVIATYIAIVSTLRFPGNLARAQHARMANSHRRDVEVNDQSEKNHLRNALAECREGLRRAEWVANAATER